MGAEAGRKLTVEPREVRMLARVTAIHLKDGGPRKPKVSWAMAITPGLGGPKVNSKGVADGKPVNIPAPPYGYAKG